MRTRTAGSCRTGAPFHGAALRVCCVLAALLLILSSAMAETAPAWEDRLAAAREKYNEKTVHVYIRGQGRDQKGKINVSFYRAGKKYIAICIRESLQINDEAEMEAVLEIVAKHKYFSEEEEDGESGEEDERPACDISEGFVLPAEKLTSAAMSAGRRIAAAIWLADAALTLAGACAAVFGRASVTPAWLLYLIAYIALMSVPALILHLITRNALLGSVPLRIALSGNILKVNDSEYKAADIERMSLGISKGRHPFRCLDIVTEDGKDRYRIDCAGPEGSVWDGCERFCAVLRRWADANGVELSVSS